MRLIDADALENEGIRFETYGGAIFIPLGNVRRSPTIEAKPVKHGRWVRFEHDENWSVCSECKCCWEREMIASCNINYCPNCGADMREDTT